MRHFECDHHPAMRISGPRVPAHYGSFETEICCSCSHWRTTTHTPGFWRRLNELPAALNEDED